MKKIKEIRIQNFKAFPDEQVFKLDGKNLLLFGENGAGKSSLYWALYTFMQSSEKDDAGVDKYFENYDPNDENTFQSLLNIHSLHGSAQSFIKLVFDDNSNIELSKNNGVNTRIPDIKDTNLASDFITYKLLYNFYSSTHKNFLNVWDVFRKDVLSFFSYGGKNYDQHYSDFYINKAKYSANGHYYPRHTHLYRGYQRRIRRFNENLEVLLGQINNQANLFLKENLNINDIEIVLDYFKKFAWDENSSRSFTKPKIKFYIKVKRNGSFEELHRPQSFLNEAILAQLSLAIRMGALFTRLGQSETKILVLDDLLISLDMDNREKILDILLQKTTKAGLPNRFDNFQILFFTHDRGLNYFIGEKIKQHGREKEWMPQEIYYGIHEEKDNTGNFISYPKPVLIEGDLSDLEKAKRYLNVYKDYTSCAVYLRKALETIIINRLPKEFVYTANGEPKALHMLWGALVKYYSVLAPRLLHHSIRALYNQSRLMLLNPQAHYNHLSLPVFKKELEQVIDLVTYVEDNCPILEPTILLTSGMHLMFTHPSIDFTYEFILTSDFAKVIENGNSRVSKPLCKILTWQYSGIIFFDTNTGSVMSQKTINDITATKETKFNSIVRHLTRTNLGIDKDMIIKNTAIKNSIWTLEEVLDKANISL